MNTFVPKFSAIVIAALLLLGGCTENTEISDSATADQADAAAGNAAAEPNPDSATVSGSGDQDAAGRSTIDAVGAPAQSVEAIGMQLTWQVAGDQLQIELTGPTEGWIAVGFHATRAMKDADIYIGFVDGENTVMTDQFGTGLIAHAPDEELGGSSHVTEVRGEEAEGVTRIRFSIPLDSGDAYDQTLVPGETVPVILAWGRADNTSTGHGERTSLQITL